MPNTADYSFNDSGGGLGHEGAPSTFLSLLCRRERDSRRGRSRGGLAPTTGPLHMLFRLQSRTPSPASALPAPASS